MPVTPFVCHASHEVPSSTFREKNRARPLDTLVASMQSFVLQPLMGQRRNGKLGVLI